MRRLAAGLLALALPHLGGCTTGSLATSTGPRPAGFNWSTASRQQVHVGETVNFDLVLLNWSGGIHADDVSDYAVLLVGDQRYQTESDFEGHYTFSHRFDNVAAGQSIPVTASAWRERGQRDYMQIAGEWLASEHPDNRPDVRVAGSGITLTVYQATIELDLGVAADELLPNTGVLEIRRADGASRLVYPAAPGKPGFEVIRPPDGSARIRFLPQAEDLNPSGETALEFRVNDRTGNTHRTPGQVSTP